MMIASKCRLYHSFSSSSSSSPELASIAVTYRQPTSNYSPNLSSSHKNKEWLRPLNRTSMKLRTLIHRGQSPKHATHSPKHPSFQSFIDTPVSEEGQEEDEEEEKDHAHTLSKRTSSEGESVGGGSHGHGGSQQTYGRSDSFGRNVKPSYHLYGSNLRRSGSGDTFSSQSTLVPKLLYDPDDSSLGITDYLQLDYGRKGLTPAKILAHTKSEARKHQMYSHNQRELDFGEKDASGSSGAQSPSDDSGRDIPTVLPW